jgi:hypothetical protein
MAGPEPSPLIQIKPRFREAGTVSPPRCGLPGGRSLTDQLHPLTPHHLPFYIVKPGKMNVLMPATGVFLILAVLGVRNIYLRPHSPPERMAHKAQKLQFEIVAILGLISLFTHAHIFWIAGRLLALTDLPDFSTPLTHACPCGGISSHGRHQGAGVHRGRPVPR